jgi:hypothetical protein
VFFVQNSCGDWCAKFVIMQVDSEIEINICDKRFVIDSSDFVDERTVPTKVKNSLEV